MELFIPEVSLIFWMLIPFIVTVFVLAKYAWPAILKGVETRNNYIDESLLMAQQARDELAKVKEDSENLIENARKEQLNILAEAAKMRDKIVDDAKEKASSETARQIENAKKQIALEKEDAIRSVRREVAILSVGIAEKVLRSNLDDKKEQMDMINRLLDEINIPKS
ncbi:MAG: F0F1 ATP synthase subunit B [Paludibacteraceae bacterium]